MLLRSGEVALLMRDTGGKIVLEIQPISSILHRPNEALSCATSAYIRKLHAIPLPMRTLLFVCTILFFAQFVVAQPIVEDVDVTVVNETMAEATVNFIESLTGAQREITLFPFDGEERMNFNYVPIPGKRRGLRMKDMEPDQRAAVHRLLQTTLSAQGYLKSASIQQVERILGLLEGRPGYRDPENYFLTIFGSPGDTIPWGWRFEGHHLSLNFSSVDNEVAVTPAFMGSNPGQVKEGPFAGLQILHAEIDEARELMHLLSSEQRQLATIEETAPREIITGNDRTVVLDGFVGLSYTDMTEMQQQQLRILLHIYLDNMHPDLASAQAARIAVGGWENLYFAWAGGLGPGVGHYYRIHGPTILIEYDNTQNEANHPHSVWRDLTNDFGRDLLREHYRNSGEGHGH